MENVSCPVCQNTFPSLITLNDHLDSAHFSDVSGKITLPAFFTRTSDWFAKRVSSDVRPPTTPIQVDLPAVAGPPTPLVTNEEVEAAVEPMSYEGRRRDLTPVFTTKRKRHLQHIALTLTRLENRYAKVST